MSEPVNVSPGTRFDEATPDQFRKFWEGQGWKVDDVPMAGCIHAKRYSNDGLVLVIQKVYKQDTAFVLMTNFKSVVGFARPMTTFGEALRYANNLAQAELFGGWAE